MMTETTLQGLKYIVIEGPIGVGKTTLAKKLAQSFGSDLILESPDENPFLERFYQDQKNNAFQTQLFFLFQRARQLEKISQDDMFQPVRVADYLMQKDYLFAELTLDHEEFKLYQQVYEFVTSGIQKPDLVIYLQAPVSVLQKRISRRGRHYERAIPSGYLQRLGEGYARFFHNYNESPLLIVNAAEINFVENQRDYLQLFDQVCKITSGRHYYNPLSS